MEATMTKHAVIDETRLKAAVQAIQERERQDINQAYFSRRAEIARLRRDLANRLEPLFADAGLDIGKIKKLVTQHQIDVRHILENKRAETSKEFASQARIVQQRIENKKKVLELLANKPYLTTLIPIFTPYTIYSQPAGIVKDSHIEPSNNWAKVGWRDDTDSGDTASTAKLSFFFAWQNPSKSVAVIKCNSDLIVSGVAQAHADAGYLGMNLVILRLLGQLNVFAGQGGGLASEIQMTGIYGLNSWWFFWDDNSDMETDFISAPYHVSSDFIIVQPDQIVVFEVAFLAVYTISGGHIILDFDFDPGNYKIMCPALQIDLLTPPVTASTI
jgi:DNA-binding transcriptional MerR regulator